MTYIPEVTSTYTITEEEITYVIDALDKAYLYAETDDEGTDFGEALWESMGVMHNLKGEDTKTYFQTKFPAMWKAKEHMVRMREAIGDTDYFD